MSMSISLPSIPDYLQDKVTQLDRLATKDGWTPPFPALLVFFLRPFIVTQDCFFAFCPCR